MTSTPIYVTKPALPSLDDFIPYLEKIWQNNVLTNNGPFHQQLEAALCEYLGVKYISLFNNGTIALMIALKAMDLKGKVITTPYSFIATSHALLWNNLEPIFVDIEPGTFNLDPSQIEEAITPDTSAILGVHCYGYPCDAEAIAAIASQKRIKVIYDAAHAFGVKDHQGSILNYGDLSVLSFHATKVFNTFEGGAIVSHSLEMKKRIDSLKNFGMVSPTDIVELGLNGKLNEVSSAFGLLQLNYMEMMIEKRQKCHEYYCNALKNIAGIKLPVPSKELLMNYSYFPILIETEFCLSRDALVEAFLSKNIYVRKYFYPLLSELPLYEKFQRDFCYSADVAKKVICLPLYSTLQKEEQDRVIDVIKAFP